METSIVDIMTLQYDAFTPAEKKIVDYVLTHKRESQYISITELSNACNVAISTVSVFCKKLKLSGFNDFKIELAKAETSSLAISKVLAVKDSELTEDDSAAVVMSKALRRSQEILHKTAHLLEADVVENAVDLLKRARKVVILGQGDHGAMATAAWTQFSMMSSKFQIAMDAHLQTIAISTLTREDVVLYFSYSGATKEIMDAVEIIREVGAKLILVTRFLKSPAGPFADVLVPIPTDEKTVPYSSMDVLMSQLYVIEVLVNCYMQDHLEEYRRVRELSSKALVHHHT